MAALNNVHMLHFHDSQLNYCSHLDALYIRGEFIGCYGYGSSYNFLSRCGSCITSASVVMAMFDKRQVAARRNAHTQIRGEKVGDKVREVETSSSILGSAKASQVPNLLSIKSLY